MNPLRGSNMINIENELGLIHSLSDPDFLNKVKQVKMYKDEYSNGVSGVFINEINSNNQAPSKSEIEKAIDYERNILDELISGFDKHSGGELSDDDFKLLMN